MNIVKLLQEDVRRTRPRSKTFSRTQYLCSSIENFKVQSANFVKAKENRSLSRLNLTALVNMWRENKVFISRNGALRKSQSEVSKMTRLRYNAITINKSTAKLNLCRNGQRPPLEVISKECLSKTASSGFSVGRKTAVEPLKGILMKSRRHNGQKPPSTIFTNIAIVRKLHNAENFSHTETAKQASVLQKYIASMKGFSKQGSSTDLTKRMNGIRTIRRIIRLNNENKL
eukprot:TRINITY_DN11382_c0_g1_i7.p1 TRINITY_DN11382_c0_g1~~TRINITY_DN11382_c0_g1_i7.p1  ORF type:complete len:229 (-),score=44.10 TRINITY_DN11382_c0_g1_i7:122-808(-)